MGVKDVELGAAARARIRRGIELMADTVGVTLGPKGRNVILDRRWDPPVSTKDGVSVAKELELDDPTANMGVQLMIGIAARTSAVAGDGTTTALVLARGILAEAEKLVAAGHDAMAIRRGVEKAVAQAVEVLGTLSREIRGRKQITRVATIAANGDPEIGDRVGRALAHTGLDGVVSLEPGHRFESELELVTGMQIDRGLESPQLATDPVRNEASLENPRIYLYDGRLETLRQVLPILELVNAEKKRRSLLVVAEAISGEALSTLVINKKRIGLPLAAVSIPGTHERRQGMLGDLRAVVGGRLFGPYTGIEPKHLTEDDFGSARQVVVAKGTTTILGGGGRKSDLVARIRSVRKEMAAMSEAGAEKALERLAALEGGSAIIKVGGATEIDRKEREARYEDAICAGRAALREGIVPGGGVSLVRVADRIDETALPEDERVGARVLCRALEMPARQIAQNAGTDPAVVLERIRSRNGAFGFDAATDSYGDLVKAGIIDPTMVVRVALQNAASIAALVLATETSVANARVQPEKSYLDPPRPDIRNYKPRSR